ncbi:hypothetical protein [Plasticicumulans sp.]|uniref:hypothetical protein n=1 Tax=Plasticicumulans sp. TaxID=2307179 RepID=UPI0039347B52
MINTGLIKNGRDFRYYFMYLIAIFFCLCENTNAANPIILRKDIVFNDWRPATRNISSGNLISGLHTNTTISPITSPILTIHGLNNSDRYICVFIEAIGGNYRAEALTRLTIHAPTIDLDLPIETVLDELNASPNELAVIAHPSSAYDCSTENIIDSDYLLTTWNSETPKFATFLLNTPYGSISKLVLDATPPPTTCKNISLSLPRHSLRTIQNYSTECITRIPATCNSISFEIIVEMARTRDGTSGSFRSPCIQNHITP